MPDDAPAPKGRCDIPLRVALDALSQILFGRARQLRERARNPARASADPETRQARAAYRARMADDQHRAAVALLDWMHSGQCVGVTLPAETVGLLAARAVGVGGPDAPPIREALARDDNPVVRRILATMRGQ